MSVQQDVMVGTAAEPVSRVKEARDMLLAKGAPWLQRVGAFTQLAELIRQLGGDPGSVFARNGLAPRLDDPEARVPYASVVQALNDAAAETGCEHLGLLAGRMWSLADLGIVGELVANAPTVRDALRTLTVYQHLNSGGGMAFFVQRGNLYELGYAIYHPGLSNTGAMYDALLAGGIGFLREICGAAFVPSEVLMSHRKPAVATAYRNLFRVMPRFGVETSAIRFPATWLDRRIEGSNAIRYRDGVRQAERLGRGTGLVQHVCRALRLLLLQGRNSGDDVAQMLMMHRRTLNRRLKEEGTTFQALLDGVRFEVAREMLATQTIPLDDISAALGYGGIGAFMRSFRRWTGTTPGRWRRAADTEVGAADVAGARPHR
ncbi:MAG: AraC family transcriptional regulator [Proteobacteria bacterium]|nr:AraC family transcriptional regulator [Pseudomonadota bacterium]